MTTLRRAIPNDARAIADIHIAARRDALPYLPELHDDEETLGWIADTVIPNQEVWVANRGDTVDGYLAMSGTELNDLYVRPGQQGKGIGRALLEKAKELSSGELQLWTFQRNDLARAFYERHGFVAVEMTDGEGNEEREPDVRYAWSGTREES